MKYIVLLLIAASVIVGISLFGTKKAEISQQEESVIVRVKELKKESIPKVIVSSGQFSTEDETFLSFKTGGIIKAIFVKEGDNIRKGQVLASLELTEIDAAVSQAQTAFEKAQRDFNRVSNLFKDSVVSLSQYQDTKSALDIATQQLNIVKYNLRYSEIRAIGDGYVLKKFFNEGQLVGAGTPVLQTNGAQRSHWIMKVGMSDHEWSSVSVNDKASIEIDMLPGKEYKARVFRKSKGVDPSSGTLSVDLELLSPPNGELVSGLFGKARIVVSRTQEYWSVPYESVVEGEGGTGYVFTTNDQKTANKVRVKISDIRENKILIAGGLENNKYLIVSGSAYLADKSKVTIAN